MRNRKIHYFALLILFYIILSKYFHMTEETAALNADDEVTFIIRHLVSQNAVLVEIEFLKY